MVTPVATSCGSGFELVEQDSVLLPPLAAMPTAVAAMMVVAGPSQLAALSVALHEQVLCELHCSGHQC